jgi:Rha family phage regulatory protein
MKEYNALTVVPVTMSSREIAELTGKQHSNVMRDIRAMTERLSADSDLNWHCETETYTDEQGKPREMYRLDKDTTLTLVAGYDAVLRFRIIKRWQELESQQPTQSFDLATMTSTALRELAAKVEECALLNSRILTMQPKADFYDHVAGSEALFDRSDAAKLLRTGPKRLWASLREWKIVQASGTPYQKYYDLGYFRLVPVLVHKGEYSIPYQQTMVTGKGLAWLKALMDSQVMPSKALTTVGGAS